MVAFPKCEPLAVVTTMSMYLGLLSAEMNKVTLNNVTHQEIWTRIQSCHLGYWIKQHNVKYKFMRLI